MLCSAMLLIRSHSLAAGPAAALPCYPPHKLPEAPVRSILSPRDLRHILSSIVDSARKGQYGPHAGMNTFATANIQC